MDTIKRKWDKISEGKRQSITDEIIYYFQRERDEKIGVIAAGELIDFFLQNVGKEMYNQGVEDAKTILSQRVEDIKYDLDDLLEIL